MDALKLLEEQHTEVDDLISKLENARSSEKREALFAEMADKLAAHATIEEKLFYPAVKASKTEEEKELFPRVRKLLSKDELEGLGGEMSAMFEELMTRSPRKSVPSQTDEAVTV